MGICHGKPFQRSDFSPAPEAELYVNGDGLKKEVAAAAPAARPALGSPAPGKGDEDAAAVLAAAGKKSPFLPFFYSPSPAHHLFSKKSPAAGAATPLSTNSTPRRFFRRPFPPPSPAKHIRAVLARRHGSVKPNEASIPEGSEADGGAGAGLDKSFGFSKNFGSKYEIGEEVGRGHFGYTCKAKVKKGELKGQQVAVKVIPKVKVESLSHFT